MGYGGGGGGSGGGGGGGAAGYGAGGSGAGGASGYRRVGDDRTANLKVDNITSRDGKRGTDVDGIVEINSTAHFIPPSGTTAERGSRGRGLFAGGYNTTNVMNYVTIATAGNARDFGDLRRSGSTGSTSNSTRAVFNYGDVPNSIVEMDYSTISSGGGVASFGDISYVTRDGPFGAGDNTRGILGGSAGGPSNMGGSNGKGVNYIDYITFATTADSTSFGELTVARRGVSACSSPTRTIWGGGYIKPSNHTQVVDFVTTQTTGDAKDFGDLTQSRMHMGAVSSTTRGIWYGGGIYGPDAPAYTFYNIIDYITIASTGNAVDFGDTTTAGGIHFTTGTASNKIRGVIGGGSTPTSQNDISYVTIATIGNATDFGDLTQAVYQTAGASDSHGGLG